ncbi:MAG: hypothetical protein A2X61_14375 [Ignavibacteria bacterium GWB2_35_12]|nr:MAG: hypothetical protein A2X63_04525 [Ignavibacteria bacterium GWA2_35_8]OGU41090.1 MAG: hypothetical protein A2X61_14375 [Ignavibacteria bacterium GWB2_35_12]OGU86217.1 MAG: hypothetical protein A2220_14220 [Ignavibacteria bacterium RIFOXYA2_FULL_35_10]OGV22907.1 MAG: hypothetical protein A2475_10540 [Ignavibacteria bacterium RIFOXYC2_FULL_35_21]
MGFKFFIIVFLLFISIEQLFSKKPVSIKCINCNDTCLNVTNIWIMDLNNDDKYDAGIIKTCKGIFSGFNIIDKSSVNLNSEMTSQLVNGSVESKNFLFNIYDPEGDKYICKFYFDSNIASAVLEDYTQNGNEPSTYEEADNYFFTQQMGSTLLITKKAEIDVQSVLLCSLDGRIISTLQNVGGWSQFSFDLSLEPSGMYLLRFIARDRALTKRMVYVR